MENKMIHIPSGEEYGSRKEAKLKMGHGAYNRAIHNGEILFLSTYTPIDIID